MSNDFVKRLRIGIHTSADEQALRNEAADRIEQLEAALRHSHDHMHKLTAIIPHNDNAYNLTTNLMSDIRTALADRSCWGEEG